MKPKKYRQAIFVIVYSIVNNKPQYLLLKRKLHWKGWEFPKGGKRFYETDSMTLKRELKEETGLKIISIKNKLKISEGYDYDKEYSDRKKFKGQKYKTLFIVEVEKEKPRLDKLEHSNYKWVDFKTATRILTWENQKRLLGKVNQILQK